VGEEGERQPQVLTRWKVGAAWRAELRILDPRSEMIWQVAAMMLCLSLIHFRPMGKITTHLVLIGNVL
jgi:hypothetical protein